MTVLFISIFKLLSAMRMWHLQASRVISLESVTILFLPFFYYWFDYLKPFRKKWAPMSFLNLTANSARAQNSKWPPMQSKKLLNVIYLDLDILQLQVRCHFPLILGWQTHWNYHFLLSRSLRPLNPRWPPFAIWKTQHPISLEPYQLQMQMTCHFPLI